MAVASAGGIPLDEYTRTCPPGWQPGLDTYPFRLYQEKMKMWWLVQEYEDHVIGNIIAGRLKKGALRVAMLLRLTTLDGRVFIGSEALAQPAVPANNDPNVGAVHIGQLSGPQKLMAELAKRYGLDEQDKSTVAIDQVLEFRRGRMSLQEYILEHETRFDEAEARAGFVLNDVGKCYMLLKYSGLDERRIDDVKLQVHGDLTQYGPVKNILHRLAKAPEREKHDALYTQQTYENEDDAWYYDDYYGDWECCDGYDDYYDGEYDYYEEDPEYEEGDESSQCDDYYGKGKNKGGTGKGGKSGCTVCGSKWHRSEDCPVEKLRSGKGKGEGRGDGREEVPHSHDFGGAGYGTGKGGDSFRSPWRPRKGFGKGKGKGHIRKGFGKGKSRFRKGKGGKGKDRRGFNYEEQDYDEYYEDPYSCYLFQKDEGSDGASVASTGFHLVAEDGPTLFIEETSTPERPKWSPSQATITREEREEREASQVFAARARKEQPCAQLDETTESVEDDEQPPLKSNRNPLIFLELIGKHYAVDAYISVRGVHRHGLIVDPGAASGLMGVDTAGEFIQEVLDPRGLATNIETRRSTATVTGISGKPDEALIHAVLPLGVLPGVTVRYGADLLGGAGARCPGLLPLPAFIENNMVLFGGFFKNRDGLLALVHGDTLHAIRVLFTDSGHYLLPTDKFDEQDEDRVKTKDAFQMIRRVAEEATKSWSDISDAFLGIKLTDKRLAKRKRCEDDRNKEKTVALHEGQVQAEPEVREATEADTPSSPVTSTTASKPSSVLATERSQQNHQKEKIYVGDRLPQRTADDVRARLLRRYQELPEEFYNKTHRTVVSPDNFYSWLNNAKKDNSWDFWEFGSGTGKLSLAMSRLGAEVGFPVDPRYGWNLLDADHRKMLDVASDLFKPKIRYSSPDHVPWLPHYARGNEKKRTSERGLFEEYLVWELNQQKAMVNRQMAFVLENPMSSEIFDQTSLLDTSQLENYRAKQVCHLCQHGASIELLVDDQKKVFPSKRSTRFDSNIPLRHACRRCRGSGGLCSLGRPHNGCGVTINDKQKSQRLYHKYPTAFCKAMSKDLMNFLLTINHEQKNVKADDQEILLNGSQEEQVEATAFTADITHLWSCPRCKEGALTTEPHSRIPGQCRLAGTLVGDIERQIASGTAIPRRESGEGVAAPSSSSSTPVPRTSDVREAPATEAADAVEDAVQIDDPAPLPEGDDFPPIPEAGNVGLRGPRLTARWKKKLA